MACRLAVTSGAPARIGPELLVHVCQQPQAAQLIAIADPGLLRDRAASLKLPLTLEGVPDHKDPAPPGHLYIAPVELAIPAEPGKLDSRNASYVLQTLTQAIEGCTKGHFDAMVTAPVHKGVINDGGIPFSGHTEFLAERTNTKRVVMMLATPGLRVALATTHLPLKDVSAAIDREMLSEVIEIVDRDLRTQFGLENPHIMVLGLNPHAGEGGHLGREELDTIIPVIEKLADLNLSGPVPADTGFTPSRLENVDAVLAMYHDQGLPVLKYQGFGEAINVTLGLPIIRTSVDHGTALDLAGSGQADTGSLRAAIDYARTMVTQKARGNAA